MVDVGVLHILPLCAPSVPIHHSFCHPPRCLHLLSIRPTVIACLDPSELQTSTEDLSVMGATPL